MLRQNGESRLKEMYSQCRSRSELVATFIAVLELCSSGSVTITVEDDDYVICFTGVDTTEILENIPE